MFRCKSTNFKENNVSFEYQLEIVHIYDLTSRNLHSTLCLYAHRLEI